MFFFIPCVRFVIFHDQRAKEKQNLFFFSKTLLFYNFFDVATEISRLYPSSFWTKSGHLESIQKCPSVWKGKSHYPPKWNNIKLLLNLNRSRRWATSCTFPTKLPFFFQKKKNTYWRKGVPDLLKLDTS